MALNFRGRRGRVKFFIALLLIFFSGASYILGWSSFFTVKQITVAGSSNSADQQIIQEKSTIKIGDKLARLEPRVVSNLLGNISWIDHSTVSRNWINGAVKIHVWPRTPVAIFNENFIDDAGVSFTLSNKPTIELPTIFASDLPGAQMALLFLRGLPNELKVRVVDMRVVSANSISLTLSENSRGKSKTIFVLWGDRNNMVLKSKVYLALIALPENKFITYVDLSAPHAPIVK